MFFHPAELADSPRHARPLVVTTELRQADGPGIRERMFTRIDGPEAALRGYREGLENPNMTVFAGHGRFTGPKALSVHLHDGGPRVISGARFVLAAGSRAVVPPIEGLDAVPFHTSDTVMRIDGLPARDIRHDGGPPARRHGPPAQFGHPGCGCGGRRGGRGGRVVVDECQRTTVEGNFALGDLSSGCQLKHVANHEAHVVSHNLLHPEAMMAADHRFVPAFVFSDPRSASVGSTEEQSREAAVAHAVKVQKYADIAAAGRTGGERAAGPA